MLKVVSWLIDTQFLDGGDFWDATELRYGSTPGLSQMSRMELPKRFTIVTFSNAMALLGGRSNT